jgi:hypothetical protein
MGCAGSWSVDTVPAWQGFTSYIARYSEAGHYVPVPKPMPPKKKADQ